METRTIEELTRDIIERYSRYNLDDLLENVYYWNKINDVRVKNDAPVEPLIYYCRGCYNEHAIELRIPGYFTFRDRETKRKVNTIQTYDVRIRLFKNGEYKTPTHVEIVEDLYDKLSGIDSPSLRKNRYDVIKAILKNIYLNRDVMYGITLTNEQIECNSNWSPGYSIAELVSFIKWCAAQEELNYNKPTDWGKDLSFSRYFEALWAGFTRDTVLLNSIKRNTNNHGSGKPELMESSIYGNLLNHRI